MTSSRATAYLRIAFICYSLYLLGPTSYEILAYLSIAKHHIQRDLEAKLTAPTF